MVETKESLLRALKLTDAIALVIGTVIGTGVFLKTAVMAQQLGSPALVMAAWLAGGLLSIAGALAYAELGAMFPHAGGEYVYLGKAFGETPAFLYGWMQFAVAGAGGIAGLAVAFAIFVSAVVPLGGAWAERTFQPFGQEIQWQFGPSQLVALAAIVLLSAVNCVGVALGGRVQALLTAAKLLGVAVIVAGVFVLSPGASWEAPRRAGRGGAGGRGAGVRRGDDGRALGLQWLVRAADRRGRGRAAAAQRPARADSRHARRHVDVPAGEPRLLLRAAAF